MRAEYGKVYLVGAGPGDPGLLTLRGKECLERAGVVIYDTLANNALLEWSPNAEKIFVGKRTEQHTLLQEEINALLVEWAAKVDCVVRLKGGDPFVFGRGGEEALALSAAGVPFEVVPGVTAGIAAPAYAGIPVTHRDLSTSFTLITGHEPDIDFSRIHLEGTLVIYMGVKHLPELMRRLEVLGRDPNTPAAAVQWGTDPRQRTIRGTLATIAALCTEHAIESPAVVVIGAVAALHDSLAWFEDRPLFGLRIVVTRAQTQASALVRQLRERGADVFEFPTIEIKRAEAAGPGQPIGDYDWIVLTSVNGVDMLFEHLEEQGLDARALAGVRLCVIGSATADAVRKRFLRIDLMPERYVADELLAALVAREGDLEGKRFLLPRADIARSFLPTELRNHGAAVTEWVTYRTVAPATSEARADALAAYQPHIVTFTSSSTAANFCTILGQERLDSLKSFARFASIGPIASRTARELGLEIAIEPLQHDIPALVDAIADWARNSQGPRGAHR